MVANHAGYGGRLRKPCRHNAAVESASLPDAQEKHAVLHLKTSHYDGAGQMRDRGRDGTPHKICGSERTMAVAARLRGGSNPLPAPRKVNREQIEAWIADDGEGMRRFKAGGAHRGPP
jgi:hypothetical protein